MTGQLPADGTAERVLAAVAISSRRGAQVAAEVLDDVTHPAVRAVITAALDVDDSLVLDDRTAAVALAAGQPYTALSAWLERCPTMWDELGHFRALVRAAGERRRLALDLAAQLEELVGAPVQFGPAR